MDAPVPATSDELLAHSEWLHRLARALVGDAAAPDVVQDTYQIALTRPPRRDGALRPWLGGVARNVARMATRGRVRREQREQRVAIEAPAPIPSAEELVAHAQMQQRVARLVLELPEPLRATVLLRFFQGLSAADIARAQGIPAATVRSRLKDALDRIRAALDTEHRGDRRAWAVLLAPLVSGVPNPAAPIAGGLIVKTTVKIVIALVIAAALLVGTRLGGLWGGSAGSRAPSAAAKAPTPPAQKPPAPAPATAAATTRALPAVHDDDPKGSLRLEGQVIDDHDAPVAGAMVAIDTNPARVVTTEADGAFVFEGLIRRDYRIEATQGDRYGGPARLRLGDKTEPVTIRLRRGGTLEVVVSETATGKPVAAADVELRSTLTWRGKTGADGVAKLTGVGATWSSLAARAEGFAPGAMMVNTSGSPDTFDRIALSLSRGAPVSGRVVDDKGKPVAGARVVATNASEPLPVVDPRRDGVVAGTDGRFSIPVVAAGTWRLTASHGDLAPTTSVPITVDGEHARTDIELVMAAGAVVRGTVKDTAGAPVAGAYVSVVAQGYVLWRARRQAFTAADGTFAIAGLPPRPVDVVAWHESGASAIVPADLASKREQAVALTLDITGTLHGTVVDSKGQPIAEAQVIAEPEWSTGTSDRAAWTVYGTQPTVADQAGAFSFSGLPAGTYRVRAARPGAADTTLALTPGTAAATNGPPIKVTVPDEGRALGKVLLPDGKPPLAFKLTLGGTSGVAFASKDGTFALPAAGGTYPLTINGPGFLELTKDVTIADGKDTDLGTITVTPGRSISGRVVDDHGVPVARATVAAGMLLTGGGADLYIKDESIGANDTVTDDTGHFMLGGYPPASITIVAGKPGAGRSASIRLPASPDSATVDLVLAPTTSLQGLVTRAGRPLPDTVVIANPIGAIASNFFVTTGPDGTFALDALAPGAYIVYPMLGGGGNRPKDIYVRKVDVGLGAPTHVVIDATPGAVTLAVTVKTTAGAPLPMAQLLAIQASIQPATVDELRDGSHLPFTDQVTPTYMRGVRDGAATIEGMRPGMHTLCVVSGDPRDPSTAKLQCMQTTLSPAANQNVAITVPAAWVDSK